MCGINEPLLAPSHI